MAINYEPLENIDDVEQELKFFMDMAKRNKDKKDVYQATMRVIDILSEQKARIEDEGEK